MTPGNWLKMCRASTHYWIGRKLRVLGAASGKPRDIEDADRAAERWYRKAAEAGHVCAMQSLGYVLLHRGAVEEAETWTRRAVSKGNPAAMNLLGKILAERDDHEAAAVWFKRAADLEELHAPFNLAVSLYEQQRYADAETWCRRAIRQGDPDAEDLLGAIHRGMNR
ncbi:tetratricopeptide repeat protein [Amycolatopsis sp. NPDC059657]|uniref:tetratricopeptide repeat protein n=1 Tax=Amycolatopsis sp. NPDC059657 TaxID=3346899 RepID=UPI0036724B64